MAGLGGISALVIAEGAPSSSPSSWWLQKWPEKN